MWTSPAHSLPLPGVHALRELESPCLTVVLERRGQPLDQAVTTEPYILKEGVVGGRGDTAVERAGTARETSQQQCELSERMAGRERAHSHGERQRRGVEQIRPGGATAFAVYVPQAEAAHSQRRDTVGVPNRMQDIFSVRE
ncbi:unnamed protein product [Arctogadus glacialis]